MAAFDFLLSLFDFRLARILLSKTNANHETKPAGQFRKPPDAEVTRREPRYFSAQISAARRFYLALDPAPQRGLVVVSGGVEHCRPDYEIDRGGFAYPTIEFVARGTGQLVLNSQPHALTAGTVFVYGRAMPHRIITDPKAPLVKYFVVLAGQEASRLLREWNLMPGRVAHTLPSGANPAHLRRPDPSRFGRPHRTRPDVRRRCSNTW